MEVGTYAREDKETTALRESKQSQSPNPVEPP